MMNADMDSLICDLAETYHIFDYKSLPCSVVATFSCGLRDDSRIKMKLTSARATTEQLLLAAIADGVNMCAWLRTKDAETGTNRPVSILKAFTEETEKDVVGFGSAEEFEAEWNRMTGKEV